MTKRYIDYFMNIAFECAEMSSCCSRKVGAVVVKDKKIKSTGFNGVPKDIPHPDKCIREIMGIKSGERLELAECVHAEANALLQSGIVDGGIMFSTVKPCVQCTLLILNSGIDHVYYKEDYQLSDEFDFLKLMIKQSGVRFTKIN